MLPQHCSHAGSWNMTCFARWSAFVITTGCSTQGSCWEETQGPQQCICWNTWRVSGSVEWNQQGKGHFGRCAQTDTLIDLCVHSVINKLRVYSHLEFWGALLVFFFFALLVFHISPPDELLPLKMVSRLQRWSQTQKMSKPMLMFIWF